MVVRLFLIAYDQLTVLDAFVIAKDLVEISTLLDIRQYGGLPVPYDGLADQFAVHIEENQLVNLLLSTVRREKEHFVPGVRIESDLVFFADQRLVHQYAVDGACISVNRVVAGVHGATGCKDRAAEGQQKHQVQGHEAGEQS